MRSSDPALLTIAAFCITVLLYNVPLARTFGMVSVLAGVDHKTLGMLTEFSGELGECVGMKMTVIKKVLRE